MTGAAPRVADRLVDDLSGKGRKVIHPFWDTHSWGREGGGSAPLLLKGNPGNLGFETVERRTKEVHDPVALTTLRL